MKNSILWMPVKLMGIFFVFTLIAIIPVCAVFAPIAYVGSLFGNTFGTMSENFGSDYSGNFTEEFDLFVHENRVSADYNGLTACVLYDMKDDPGECLNLIDRETGSFSKEYPYESFLSLPEAEYIGSYDDSYFNDIHVLGKYTVSRYEVVGSHIEKDITGYGNTSVPVQPVYAEVEVDDYDWVYYPEIQRGKCEETETVACNIILEDQWVYPYQTTSFSLNDHYGIHVDPESYEITLDPYQEWSGDMIYAFSRGNVIFASSDEIILKIVANDIDLYARYESKDGLLFPEFHEGEIVEATEVLAYSEGTTRLYLYNSNNETVNPVIFVSLGDCYYGLGEGTIIFGMEDFAPDFSNRKVWLGYKEGGINPYGDSHMGQCTWFAWGLFYQHYGFDPGFRGNGSSCASEAYQRLKEKSWTFSRSPSPGAIFSTTNFNHVGIVAGVIDEDTMIIVEGNFNHKNDTFKEFVSLPDWVMRTVSTRQYKKGVGYVFCNPPK